MFLLGYILLYLPASHPVSVFICIDSKKLSMLLPLPLWVYTCERLWGSIVKRHLTVVFLVHKSACLKTATIFFSAVFFKILIVILFCFPFPNLWYRTCMGEGVSIPFLPALDLQIEVTNTSCYLLWTGRLATN